MVANPKKKSFLVSIVLLEGSNKMHASDVAHYNAHIHNAGAEL
jgi:hypothetical protein